MNKISTPYIEDIIKSISIIEKYLSEIDVNREAFDGDLQLQDALIRRLEIIGEATKRLEEEFKNQYPDIPWRKMAGMRDVLIHDYDEVDLDLVWEVVTKDILFLKDALINLER